MEIAIREEVSGKGLKKENIVFSFQLKMANLKEIDIELYCSLQN